jgi:hypothetical protein
MLSKLVNLPCLTNRSAGSTSRSAGGSRDQLDGAAIAAENGKDSAAIVVTPENEKLMNTLDSSSGKLRKFPSTRSFSVANFNNQVKKMFRIFCELVKTLQAVLRIRASDYWIRIRILLLSSLTFKTPTKDYSFSADYCTECTLTSFF